MNLSTHMHSNHDLPDLKELKVNVQDVSNLRGNLSETDSTSKNKKKGFNVH